MNARERVRLLPWVQSHTILRREPLDHPFEPALGAGEGKIPADLCRCGLNKIAHEDVPAVVNDRFTRLVSDNEAVEGIVEALELDALASALGKILDIETNIGWVEFLGPGVTIDVHVELTEEEQAALRRFGPSR